MHRFVVALGFATAFAPLTYAVEYNQVQPAKSSIGFQFKQMGVAMDGQFKKFSSQLRFDPAQAAKASANFEVELGSIDTGSDDADTEAAGKAWFHTKAFPTARFVSTSVKDLGQQRYEVAGKLTIKGQTKELVMPVNFTSQGKSGTLEGGFTLRRGDFNIGEGAWAKFDIVANDIVITFRITADSGK